MESISLASDRINHTLAKQNLTSDERQTLEEWQIKLAQNVIEIAAFGLVSSGKTSILNALEGKNIRETGATHGTTKIAQSTSWELTESSQPVKLIDTPGLDEINGEQRSHIALAVAKQADLILFVTTGDLKRLEQEAIAQLRSYYKPILLVFNKADLYPERDRFSLERDLQNLISANDIVFTVADPVPQRVRLEHDHKTAEIWEKPTPQIQELKLKILDLINQEGKALLAINAMRSLAEIQIAIAERRIMSLSPIRSIAALVFVIKSIILAIAPFWLDLAISNGINMVLIFVALGGYPILASGLILGFGIIDSIFVANLNTTWMQIIWIGITTTALLNWLKYDLPRHHNWGKWSAKTLIQQITTKSADNSIIRRVMS
jgi:uncharacterized protein